MNHQKAFKQKEYLDHHAASLREPNIFAYFIIQHLSISEGDESCRIIIKVNLTPTKRHCVYDLSD